jgi:hypothetical protein
MPKVFTKNMFIMLLSIMIGAVIITYFIADIERQSEIETYKKEIQTITFEKEYVTSQSKNFTDNFFKSLGSLDLSREYRSEGNAYFDLAANINYHQKDYDKIIENCTQAMELYIYSYENFLDTKDYFNDTKAYTNAFSEVDAEIYIGIIDLYIDLSQSGANLCMIRYNASKYLIYIAENLSLYNESVNITDLLELYNFTKDELYFGELSNYNGIKEEIENEYGQFFNPIRETP